ncbi:MAG: hypothetical protein ACLUOI_16785 [Eisenbergiella sp.]
MYKDKYELFRLELVRVVIQFNQRYFNKAIFKANMMIWSFIWTMKPWRI